MLMLQSVDGYLLKKRDLSRAFFDSVGLEVIGREATLYLWVKVPEGRTAEEWAMRLLNLGIGESKGNVFCYGHPQNYVRLAMVPDKEECHEAIALWAKALEGEAL